MATENKYLEQFQHTCYTILEGLIDLQTINIWKKSYHQLIQEFDPIQRPSKYGLGKQIVMDNLVEHAPKIMLPSAQNQKIAGKELLITAMTQTDSTASSSPPPITPK